jgi:putative ABC transport system substrate-binding protein
MAHRSFTRLTCPALAVIVMSAAACKAPETKKVPTIAVANYGAHPLIDVTIAAFKGRLAELGYEEGKNVNIEWSSVEGNVNLAPQMVSALLAKSPNVIVSLTTPISQAVAKRAKGKVPVVFCGVTDPIGAGLVPSWNNDPASGITGTSDRWPYAEQLDLIRQLVPKARRVGIPFNSGESNSRYALDQIQPLAQARGLEVVTAVATDIGEVRKAVDSLVARGVDVIYVTSDNTVMAGFESVLKVAHERKIPVIVGESANVERGGLATYSVDYTELGRATADLTDKVLKGAIPGSLPIVAFKGAQLYINPDAAEKMGVTVPADVLGRAKIVHTKPE